MTTPPTQANPNRVIASRDAAGTHPPTADSATEGFRQEHRRKPTQWQKAADCNRWWPLRKDGP